VEQFEKGENQMANLDTEEKKNKAVTDFVLISTKAEVGEDEATIPDLVDELYKLCVYLLRISNVCRSTGKESTVMKDIFGENLKYQQIFVTWMIVLQRNTTSDTWDAEADVKVLDILLFAQIKRWTVAANGKNKAPPLALESAKLNEVFGEEAKALTNPFDIFAALMLGIYLMSAPSGNLLGDFIKQLEEDKDRWTAPYNTLGAMLFNGMKVSAVCRFTAFRTDRFTNILLSRRQAGWLSVAKLCVCLQHQAQYAHQLEEHYKELPQNVAGVCSILRKMVHYEVIPQNLVAKRGVCLQHQAQYARRLREHYKVMPQNAAWGLKYHAQDGTL
jgi:hypothetical protein